MFVSEAHSVTQQSRLAITLAWIAGYTNAVTLLACHTATSHISGTTSNLGIAVASKNWGLAAFSLFLLISFLIGAAVSGFATDIGRRMRWGSIYVLPMAIQAILLTGFALTIEFVPTLEIASGWFLYLATALTSMAMGLQNATITRISRGVVRTTHVTGVLTDIGLEGAHYLSNRFDKARGREPILTDFPTPTGDRLLLLLSIVGSFALGTALGTIGFQGFASYAMFPPVLFLAWIIFIDIHKPIAEIVPSTAFEQAGMSGCSVFRIRADPKRPGINQRMPNLALWSSLLSPAIKLVVLDLSEIASISNNSLEELRTLAEQFKDEGRAIVVAGYRAIPEDLVRIPPFYRDVKAACATVQQQLSL